MRQVLLSDVPGATVDTDGVAAAARAVAGAAEGLRTAGSEAVGIWAALPHAYDAPEAPALHAAMSPVAHGTSTYADAAGAAASALARYAEDVAAVQARMSVAAVRVEALATRIASTPVWRSDPSITTQNTVLQRQLSAAQDDLGTAADVCASAIRSTLHHDVFGVLGPPLAAAGLSRQSEGHQALLTGRDPRSNPFFFLHKTPADVNAWWTSLTPAEQRMFITDYPHVVGARDGIPAAVRDEANRILLVTVRAKTEREICDLEEVLTAAAETPHVWDLRGRRTEPGPWSREVATFLLLVRARERLRAVEALERTIGRTKGGRRHLLSLRLDRDRPQAAVAIGDVDKASRVGVFVGGTGTTVAGRLEEYDLSSQELLARSRAIGAPPRDGTAIVTWLGYDAPPELMQALAPGWSKTGGRGLASFVDGLQSTTTSPQPTGITLYGHSYGSLVVNEAAARTPDSVESVVVAGAPGVGRKSADGVARYALLAPRDEILYYHAVLAETSLGLVPYEGASDANDGPWRTLSTRSSTTHDGSSTLGISGHSDYLLDESTSQWNVAAVMAGKPEHTINHYKN